jgi:urea carboxylase
MDFVGKNNAFTEQQFHDVFLNSVLVAVAVGFFRAPLIGSPIDLRKRINRPKMNLDRVSPLEGQASWADHGWQYITWRVLGV